ncbi:MAG: bifunctional demethylmenaquinone methyltransferase/2-methoxy-6-polyprenyl-1,4-benzoquinol methylase UbiE [Saprospiraceae bacterium]|nr:bifunctional demethylmenaquinone methyltransferase/2-methoxy-6-polyprenyl-1,4-benzoquinol methylase UbiE [Saprospiraceae bacterium]
MRNSTVKPYQDKPGSKKEQVTAMFNRISGRYDLLNKILSLGIDRLWRRKLVRWLSAKSPSQILDVATGTADLAIAISKANPGARIQGLDIAQEMLDVGQIKIDKLSLDQQITLKTGDAESLPYPDASFDAVSVAFGVRNFESLENGLAEMYRVLRPGGQVWVLEFSQPRGWFRPIFLLYFRYLLPLVGRLTSKDQRAYTYLFESVQAFPEGESFLNLLRNTGFTQVSWSPLTFGTCSIYTGTHS